MEKPKATTDNQDWNSSMMSSPKSDKMAADPAAEFYSLKYFRTCLALHLVWKAEDTLDQARKRLWREFSGSEGYKFHSTGSYELWPGWPADVADPNKIFLRGSFWARLPTSTAQEEWWEKPRDLWTHGAHCCSRSIAVLLANSLPQRWVVGIIATANSAWTVTATSFPYRDIPQAWENNHSHRKLPFAFLRRLGSDFSLLHWGTIPCLWAFQKHPFLPPTGSAWSPRKCTHVGLIWAPGVRGDSFKL